MLYFFKHKDTNLALIESTQDNNFVIKNLFVELALPMYMLKSDALLHDWLQKRQATLLRDTNYELTKLGNIHNDVDFVNVTMCLSITDCFWIVSVDKQLFFQYSNLYTKVYNNLYTSIAAGISKFNGSVSFDTSPEYTIGGSTKKFIQREGTNLYMYKAESPNNITSRRVETASSCAFSEFLVSQLLTFLKISHSVNYTLGSMNTSEEIWSKCELFTNLDLHFMSLNDYILANSENGVDHISEHIEDLLIMFNGDYLSSFKNMILIDCMVLNFDRHSENMGFLYDDDFNIVNIAPMFDFNRSLFYNITLADITKEKFVEYIKVNHPKTDINNIIYKQFMLCTDYNTYQMLQNIRANFKFKNHNIYKIAENRLKNINILFKRKISKLIKICETNKI